MFLLIVSGMSGAGKSLALKSLEELGFFCVDNLPSPMLKGFVDMCEKATPAVERAAVTIDSRESLLSRSSESVMREIEALEVPYEILFLDARSEVLRARYNETRKRHPLGEAGEAASGVRSERAYLRSMRDAATHIVDTSDIAARDFSKFFAKFIPEMGKESMSVVLSSFGYKRGVPVDADIVVDMRFAENPFYYEEMRHLSGLDETVRNFVLSQPYVQEYFDTLEKSILDMIPLFEKQDKHILRICFGCTGGRHRSVTATEEMARRLRASGQSVRSFHRDMKREEQDIDQRFGKEKA